MIRVIQYGLGPIGVECAKAVLDRKGLRLIGAIDIDPEKIGFDLAELLDLDAPTEVTVSRSDDVLAAGAADVAILTTASSMETIRPQIEGLIDAGLHVVSSSEDLFFPWFRAPDIARSLDRRARDAGVVVIGTGVNPGLVMDVLPVVLTAPCRRVSAVRAERVLDLASRRFSLQRKLGVGLTPQEFRRSADRGRLGHRGLAESVAFVAHALGWALDEIREETEPVIAEVEVSSGFLTVARGAVAGVSQVAAGLAGGRERVRLDLEMYVGAADPADRVWIDGDPPVRATIEGGVPGDRATVAALLNAIPNVLDAPPGLRTMSELTLPHWIGEVARPGW